MEDSVGGIVEGLVENSPEDTGEDSAEDSAEGPIARIAEDPTEDGEENRNSVED